MNGTIYYSYLDSPVGQLIVRGDGEFITGLFMAGQKRWYGPDAAWRQDDGPFAAVRAELEEYFAGSRQQFDVPLRMLGTPFQRRVWQELVRIPFGTTINYGELAARVGQPNASRAVGNANGRNSIAIMVPCHRVIGASGKLTGYAGGLDKKAWLLDWERRATEGDVSAPRSAAVQRADVAALGAK